jgi:ribosomal protein S12 methylthiotransferase
MSTQRVISESINKSRIGSTVDVIIDGAIKESIPDGFSWEGRTQWDAPEVDGKVFIKGSKVQAGDIVAVQIQSANDYDLFGECNEP